MVTCQPALAAAGECAYPNLLFMSEGTDKDSKTEAPSQKKLEDARKRGQIVKSQDLSAAMSLGVIAIFLMVFLTLLYETRSDNVQKRL